MIRPLAKVYLPCSSTNPVSWRDFWQVPCEQVKWDGHHVLPNAVMKGPLEKYYMFILKIIVNNICNTVNPLNSRFSGPVSQLLICEFIKYSSQFTVLGNTVNWEGFFSKSSKIRDFQEINIKLQISENSWNGRIYCMFLKRLEKNLLTKYKFHT